MRVEIYNKTKSFRGAKALRFWASKVFAELEKRKVWSPGLMRLPVRVAKNAQASSQMTSLQLIVVGEAEGKKLNWAFRKKDYATDVLSFAPNEPDSLGEIVICLPVIQRQSKENGWSVVHELNYMVLHGVLHLLGYDHEKSDKDARAMYRLQDSIFQKLTIKPQAIKVKAKAEVTTQQGKTKSGARNRTQRYKKSNTGNRRQGQ